MSLFESHFHKASRSSDIIDIAQKVLYLDSKRKESTGTIK